MRLLETERQEILDRIKVENELIHQRMTWLGTFQGLLFGAVAFAWKEPNARPFIYLAAVVGLLVTLSIGFAIYRANQSLVVTTGYWDKIKPKQFRGIDAEGYRTGRGASWLMPGAFIPPVFGASWVLVGLLAYFGR